MGEPIKESFMGVGEAHPGQGWLTEDSVAGTRLAERLCVLVVTPWDVESYLGGKPMYVCLYVL